MEQAIADKLNSWIEGPYDEESKSAIRRLMESNQEAELVDSFYKSLTFGTGGLRGIMGPGTNRMNIYTVAGATQGLANYLLSCFTGLDEIKVAVAYDSRFKSDLFAQITADVFSANGIKVFLFDNLRPTPELSFAVRELKCQSGIVITASHNPKEYNGYKVYWDDGAQILPPHDRNIIAEVEKIDGLTGVKMDRNEGLITIIGPEMDRLYLDRIQTLSLNPQAIEDHHDLKIVYTPLHGAGITCVPRSLAQFGFTSVHVLAAQAEPNGDFPTVLKPNPEEEEALELALAKAMELDADLVLATDPDADRVGIAVKNERGEIALLNGNQTGSLLIYYLLNGWKEGGKLVGREYVVKTIVTTELIALMARAHGVICYDVLTGFKYIADMIKRQEGKQAYIGGGEESYGYLAGEFIRDKDAVMACSLIAEMAAWARAKGKSLYDILIEIYLEFGLFKEKLVSLYKTGKEGSEEIQRMMAAYRAQGPEMLNQSRVIIIKDYLTGRSTDKKTGKQTDIKLPESNVLQFLLEDGSLITARPSGTEPKIKFYVSVNDKLVNREDYRAKERELDERIDQILRDLGLG